MAWIIDPNFNSTMYAVDARTPFITTGGNRMLNLSGSGVAYRDDISIKDLEISGRVFFDDSISLGGFRGAALIARRQPDGSFYIGRWVLGGPPGGVNSVQVGLHYYNGTTDVMTSFSSSITILPISELVVPGDLISVHFRLKGNALSMRAMDSAGTSKIVECGVSDTSITLAGNPGIGGEVIGAQFAAPRLNNPFLDNFQINEI